MLRFTLQNSCIERVYSVNGHFQSIMVVWVLLRGFFVTRDKENDVYLCAENRGLKCTAKADEAIN